MLRLVADVTTADEPDAATRQLSAAASFVQRSPRRVTLGFLSVLANAVAPPLVGVRGGVGAGAGTGAAHVL